MDVTRIVDFYLDRINRRYDPESDAGRVTWADKQIVDALSDLTEQVIKLTERVVRLEKAMNAKG